MEHPPVPLLEPNLCTSDYPDVVLNNDRDSTLILHDISFGKQNFCVLGTLHSTMCPYEDHNHPLILVVELFRRMVEDAYVYHKYCKSHGGIVVLTLQLER